MTIKIDPAPELGSQTPPSRRSPRAKPAGARPSTGTGSATWPLRIVLAVVCVVWLIPVVGLLINSFRPRDSQFSSGCSCSRRSRSSWNGQARSAH